jgi:hypothetical protein
MAALAVAEQCAAQKVDLTPQFEPPRAGVSSDRTFIVRLPREVGTPCVAIDAITARILVSRKGLETLAAARRLGADWKGEDERMAMIHGDRARTLLGAARPAKGIECGEVVSEGALRDAKYLVVALLVSGNAMVVDAKGSRVTERMRIDYKATAGVGGFSTCYLDRGEMFFYLEGWVS